jgi:hypothetical protein
MKNYFTYAAGLLSLFIFISQISFANFPQKYKVLAKDQIPKKSFVSELGKKYSIKVKGTYSLWPQYNSTGADAVCVYAVPAAILNNGMWPPIKDGIKKLREDTLFFIDNNEYFPRTEMNNWTTARSNVRINPLVHIGFRFDNKPIPINPFKYNQNNTYEFEYTGTGKPFDMVILDSYYSIPDEKVLSKYDDNSGELEIDIDTVKPVVPCSGPELSPIIIYDSTKKRYDTTYVVKLGLTVNQLVAPNEIRTNKYLSNKLAIYENGEFKCPLVECNKDSIEQDLIAVSMIIDESGSMNFPISLTDSTKRLDAARKSANSFVDGLSNGDEVMLHTFSDFLTKRVDWTTDKKKVKDAIDAIIPKFGTSMESSLIRVLQEVEQKNSLKKYIVLLTDGEDTDDFTTIYDVFEAIEENKQSGEPVPIFTIALALIDTTALDNLQEIAKRSNGKFFSANNTDSLSMIYSKIYNIIDTSRCCEFTYELVGCKDTERDTVIRKITIMYPDKGIVDTKELTYKLDCTKKPISVFENYIYNQVDEIRVSELSPNPTSNSGSIAYDITEYSKVSIALFDINGNMIQQFLDGNQDIGHYRLYIDLQNQASGTYSLVVTVNDKRVIRKFILSK